jgi:Ca2+-binding RTX toxin-like protein
MANVLAIKALNIDTLNLNDIYKQVDDFEFYDNSPYSYGLPVTFPDAIELYYGSNTLAFAGKDFLVSNYSVTGGVLQGVINVGVWKFYGLSLDAAKVYDATVTKSTSDDLALLTKAFSGNDTMELSGYNDKFRGFSGDDIMKGNAGNDTLMGDAGNDTLNGGTGADSLIGGTGSDLLYGGTDSVRDVFIFNSIADSKTGSTRDKVYDFRTKVDDLDLRGIDANTNLTGDQKFGFNTTTAKANSVWYKVVEFDGNAKTKEIIVYGDVNGDAKADFEIGLMGVSSITASDFLL